MNNANIDYCAGGIVWKTDGTPGADREVLVIKSRDDQAWKFPKGHIDPEDATWEAAAQREVREETGYATRITDFAGFTKYPVKAHTKVVLYWHMEPAGDWAFEPSDEIELCEWLPVREAIDRLTFLNDKRFLLQFTRESEDRPLSSQSR
ncbi:MAG: NUDIX domain-containing protein [Blastocatellia bacterium]|nr:NUDIX domain-containing protein [Blastocatellia bacterium]